MSGPQEQKPAQRPQPQPQPNVIMHPAALEWAKVFVVPVSLAIITAGVAIWQSGQDERQAQQRVSADYVSLAVGLLQQPPPGSDASERLREADLALRDWSVDVLVVTSPVRIEDDLQAALRQGEVQVPSSDLLTDFNFDLFRTAEGPVVYEGYTYRRNATGVIQYCQPNSANDGLGSWRNVGAEAVTQELIDLLADNPRNDLLVNITC